METNNELFRALTLAQINVEEWDRCTPEERRTNYHTQIIKMIRLNHPDKHATLSKDSPEFHQFVENTKRLNSIDYQSSTGSMNRPQEQAEEASARAEYSAAVSVPFTPPKTAAELLSKLNGTGPFYDASGKGSPYFQAVKEYIPNLLSWTQWGDMDQSQCGKESGWVISQISTKFYLKGYQGADILVSALVSRDQDRIKKAFDEMLTHIKNKNVFQRGLFWSTNSLLDDFINQFCRFKPISEMGGLIAGIDASTVIVLCQSLSLDLPYNIIDLDYEVDNHLIRDLLMHYVAQHGNTLQLEAGGAAEPLEQQPSKR